MRVAQRFGALASAMAGAGVLLMVSASPVAAHAVLESTTPADGATVQRAPDRVTLTFDEPVSVPSGGLRVHDSAGEQVTSGTLPDDRPEMVVGDLPGGLAEGTYIVTWRVVSADGHPVKGAFVFSVGPGGGVSDSVVEQVFSASGDRPAAIAAAGGRWLSYAGTLVAAGAVAFLGWVAGPAGRRWLGRLGVGAAGLAAVAALLAVPLQAAQASGAGLAAAFTRGGLLAETVVGPVGLTAAVQLVGLAVVAAALLRPDRDWFRPVAVSGAGLALGGLLLSGHTRTVEPLWVMGLADGVHLAAGAVWFGGLVMLAVALRDRRLADDPVGGARMVARFSLLATGALAAVTAGGLAMSWVLVRTPRAAVSTVFGWTLLAKVAVVVGVAAVGAYNHRRLVPAIEAVLPTTAAGGRAVPAGGAGSGDEGVTAAGRAWRRLSRTVRWEAAGLMAVLGVTAVLVYLQPAAEAAGVTGAYSTYVDVGADMEVNLVVDPNRTGRNEIHLYLLDATGRPARADELTIELSLPAEDIGPISRTPAVAGPGHWLHVGSELVVAGRWEIAVEIDVSEFEQLRTTVPVTVNPA